MKVVINKKSGGFELSAEAFELYLNKKGIEFEKVSHPVPLIEYYYYKKGHLYSNEHILSQYNLLNDNRADKDLIAVVEELGEKANTCFSKLKIVEIPDGISYRIEERYGMEVVSETHRTWE